MGVSAGQRVTAVAAAGSSRVHGSVRANELGHFIPLCGKVKPSSLYERADVDAHLGVEINCKACLVAASELAEAGATEVMVGSRVTVAHDGPGTVVSVEGPDISVRVDSDGTVVSCDEYDIEPMGHSVVSPNEWEAELLATPVVLADPGCADEENMTHEAIDAQLSAEAASLPDGLDAARPQDATRATAKGHKIYSHLRFVYYGRGKSAAAQGIAAYIAIGGGLITVYRHADNSRVDTFGSAMKFWALPMRSLTEAEKQIIIEDYRAETARIRAAREAAGRPAKNAELRHDAYLASIVVASNCATCGPRDAKICGWCYDANSDGSRKESELIEVDADELSLDPDPELADLIMVDDDSTTVAELARELGMQDHELAAYGDLGAVGGPDVVSGEDATAIRESMRADAHSGASGSRPCDLCGETECDGHLIKGFGSFIPTPMRAARKSRVSRRGKTTRRQRARNRG